MTQAQGGIYTRIHLIHSYRVHLDSTVQWKPHGPNLLDQTNPHARCTHNLHNKSRSQKSSRLSTGVNCPCVLIAQPPQKLRPLKILGLLDFLMRLSRKVRSFRNGASLVDSNSAFRTGEYDGVFVLVMPQLGPTYVLAFAPVTHWPSCVDPIADVKATPVLPSYLRAVDRRYSWILQ